MPLPHRLDTQVPQEEAVRRPAPRAGGILAALVEQMDGVEKVEGSACADHIHICLRIAPKHAVSSVVGKLKGRSAIVLFGRDRTLWARGYYVSTVGLDEAAVRKYIRSQEEASAIE